MHLDNAKHCADKCSEYKVFNEQGDVVYPVDKTSTISLYDIVKEVIDGKWGNGAQRKSSLVSAGYDYDKVQQRANELMSGKAHQYQNPLMKSQEK